MLDGVGDGVGDQAHGGLGREGVGPAREVLLDDVVLRRALERRGVDAGLLGGDDVEREQPRGRRVDRHRRVHAVERDAVEQRPHVALVADRHADLADLAARELVVGVVARLGRQVEGDGEPGLPLGEVAAVELVRADGRGVPRVGPHHPGLVRLGQAVGHGGDCPASGMTPRHARDRHPAPRPGQGDLLLGGRRRPRRPGARVHARHRARGAGRRGAARGPAHPHPLRPRGRERARSCAAGRTCRSTCTSAGRATWPSPERLVASAARLYGGEDGLRRLWGEVVPVPEANLQVLTGGETRPRRLPRRVHARPRVAPRLVPPHADAAPRSSATSRACGSRPTATWSRRRRRPTSTSRRGSARSTSSRAGSPRRSRSPTTAASTTSRRTSRSSASGCTSGSRSPRGTARRRSWPASRSASERNAPELAAQYEQAAPPEHLYLGVRRYLDKRAEG